jgi:predicted membrane chloride channel (bestrophin family)
MRALCGLGHGLEAARFGSGNANVLLAFMCLCLLQIVWHTLLPIALVPQLGWMTVPVTALVAYFMMGVEDIGVTIEEPYKQLALDATVSRCVALPLNPLH